MGDNDTSQAHTDMDIRCLLLLIAGVKTLLSVRSSSGIKKHGSHHVARSGNYQFALPCSAQRYLSLTPCRLAGVFQGTEEQGVWSCRSLARGHPGHVLSRLSKLDIRASTTLYHVLVSRKRVTPITYDTKRGRRERRDTCTRGLKRFSFQKEQDALPLTPYGNNAPLREKRPTELIYGTACVRLRDANAAIRQGPLESALGCAVDAQQIRDLCVAVGETRGTYKAVCAVLEVMDAPPSLGSRSCSSSILRAVATYTTSLTRPYYTRALTYNHNGATCRKAPGRSRPSHSPLDHDHSRFPIPHLPHHRRPLWSHDSRRLPRRRRLLPRCRTSTITLLH